MPEKSPTQQAKELRHYLRGLDEQLQAGSLTEPRYRFLADLAHQELDYLEGICGLPEPLGDFSDNEL